MLQKTRNCQKKKISAQETETITWCRSQAGKQVWSVEGSAIKVKIIPTLQFASQNVLFSCDENVAACYLEQFPDSSIAKNVKIEPTRISYLVT